MLNVKGLLITLLIFFAGNTTAQNLVVNSSFEDYDNCPGSTSLLYEPSYTGPVNVTDWYRPGWGTSDYFNACVPGAGVYGVPLTGFGYQDAKDGSAFVGGIAAADEDTYQEYVQGRLNTPLSAGHKIYASFWTVVASHIFLANGGAENLGMFFTNSYIYDASAVDIDDEPQVGSPANYEYTDTVNWEQVSGTFTASGGESWLTIGSFPAIGDPDEELAMVYMFYDDVCVLDLNGAPSSIAVHDTVACPGNPISLSVEEDESHYFWENGTEFATRMIDTPGVYWVQLVNYKACTFSVDTFRVKNKPGALPVNIGNDTSLCAGQTLLLSSYDDKFERYSWNTGDTGATIVVTAPGQYYVTAYAPCYIGTDTILVTGVEPPDVTLPSDTIVCKGAAVELHYYQQGGHYQWSTGSDECCITVNEPGVYSLTVTNICGNSDKDEIEIVHTDCNHCILAPSAFSPNGDGLNDNFEVQVNCPMKEYKLSIFNRWGQLVFATVKPGTYWNGLMNGKIADLGVYFYYIEAIPAIEGLEKIRKKGDVTLLR